MANYRIISDDPQEWYGNMDICGNCNAEFMADDAIFCPYCGIRFTGVKKGKEIVWNDLQNEK